MITITMVGAFLLSLAASTTTNTVHAASYGVDASFPIHHNFIGANSQTSRTSAVFGSDRIATYYNYLVGCMEHHEPSGQARLCQENENARFNYNLKQPQALQNYTDVGFKVVRLSEETWAGLQEFWTGEIVNHEEKHVGASFPDGMAGENWPAGNTYVNYWDRPTQMVSVQTDEKLTNTIWREAEEHMRQWIPQAKLFTRSDIYGIRIYRNGHMLAPHVDRDPLVSSAIINVDQDGMEEPWPLEVYDHSGVAHNVTVHPGEMILYESHTVIHGRPFPLKGNYYANIFIHFKPYFDGYEEYMHYNEGYYAEGEVCTGRRPLPASDDRRAVYTTMLACCKGEFASQTSGKCIDGVIDGNDESEGEL